MYLVNVARLVTAEVQVAQVDEVEVASREIHWVSVSGPGSKKKQKKPSTPRGTINACSSTCMDEVELFWMFWYLRC